ncbi:MAG: hypothetical protein JNL01_12275 [Bdellovibrionales bacterium]|nr:hypothetical protein [Bdellovibrionales bacterium]
MGPILILEPRLRVAQRNSLRNRIIAKVCGILWAAIGIQGCATPYLPSSPMLTPEALGPNRRGQIDLSAQAGSSFWEETTRDADGNEVLSMAAPRFTLGYSIPLSESSDLFIHLATYSPPMVGYKYQFEGRASDQVDRRQFAGAFAISAGGIWGKLSGPSGTTDDYSYFLAQIAVPLGYRVWRYHQFGVNPFLRLGSLSGTSQFETGSFTQYGASLSYQYENESMFWRIEPAYVAGSFGSNQLPMIQGGILLGFRIDR